MDTTNILFICGGAFVGLDTTIEQRIGRKTMGFKADIKPAGRRTCTSCSPRCSPRTSSSSG